MLNYDQRIRLLEIAAETTHPDEDIVDTAKKMEAFVTGEQEKTTSLADNKMASRAN